MQTISGQNEFWDQWDVYDSCTIARAIIAQGFTFVHRNLGLMDY